MAVSTNPSAVASSGRRRQTPIRHHEEVIAVYRILPYSCFQPLR